MSGHGDSWRGRFTWAGARSLGEHIKRLAKVGLFVGVRDRHLLLTGGVSGEPSSWRAFEIQFQAMAEAQLANADGAPFDAQPGRP